MRALILALLIATPAHAATLDVALGNLTYWPINLTPDAILGVAFPVADTSLISLTRNADLTHIEVGGFSADTVLLGALPVGNYACPTGEACRINQFGLAVYLTRSIGTTPGSGGLILDPNPSYTVDEPATIVLMLAAFLVLASMPVYQYLSPRLTRFHRLRSR